MERKSCSLSFVHVSEISFFDRIVRQGKLFQKCTHLLYCSVLSLGGNINTRRMSKPEMGSIFHIKNRWNILVIGNYYVNYQNFLTSSDTKRTLMHLFLFTNSAQRELVSICTQSIHNRNKLSLPYILGSNNLVFLFTCWHKHVFKSFIYFFTFYLNEFVDRWIWSSRQFVREGWGQE